MLNRRRWLQIGAIGCAGAMPFGSPRGQAAQKSAPVRACIFIFYQGGPSQLDTWDMKPKAPAEVRGPFQPIATSVPGFLVSEHLPHLARIADRVAIIRSLHHRLTQHLPAAYTTLIGRDPPRGDQLYTYQTEQDPPSLGSAISKLRSPPGLRLPPFVAAPHRMFNEIDVPGQSAGFLGSAYEPLQLEGDPNRPDFRLPELELPPDVTQDRLGRREKLRHSLQDSLTGLNRLQSSGNEEFRARAIDFLGSDIVRQAFDLNRENAALRERYGRNQHGQSLLLARRLVEFGVPFVAVYDRKINGQESWDTHSNHFALTKDSLLPPADRGLAALIEDLDSRGLLESTLIVALGEFGRTPRINANSGRDHWPFCYSGLLAGGGARGGLVHGSSDALAAYPKSNPVTAADLAATLFWRFGLDPADEIHDRLNRPYRLADGEPLQELFDVG